MKTYWESEGIHNSFLTLALDGGEWSVSCTGHYPQRRLLIVPNEEFYSKYIALL